MEKYYAVMKINTATARNENFRGECHTHIYGKGDEMLFSDSGCNDFNIMTPYFVRKYGYKRVCDAKRNWTFTHPDIDRPYWEAEVKVIEIWVGKNDSVKIISLR